MTIEETEARSAPRETPGGVRVTYDDGQNVRVEGMAPCPWCGPVDGETRRPYVQVSRVRSEDEARAVCPVCHAATAHVGPAARTFDRGGRELTRDLAIEMAVERWNGRAVDTGALEALAAAFECGSGAWLTGREVADRIRSALGRE